MSYIVDIYFLFIRLSLTCVVSGEITPYCIIYYLISSKDNSISSISTSSDVSSLPLLKSTTTVASKAMINDPTKIPTR